MSIKLRKKERSLAIKELIFSYLDQFLAPEMLDMPLPKPNIVQMMIGKQRCGIRQVYYRYRQWRKIHADDRRVIGHDVRYHVSKEDEYHECKNTNCLPVL